MSETLKRKLADALAAYRQDDLMRLDRLVEEIEASGPAYRLHTTLLRLALKKKDRGIGGGRRVDPGAGQAERERETRMTCRSIRLPGIAMAVGLACGSSGCAALSGAALYDTIEYREKVKRGEVPPPAVVRKCVQESLTDERLPNGAWKQDRAVYGACMAGAGWPEAD